MSNIITRLQKRLEYYRRESAYAAPETIRYELAIRMVGELSQLLDGPREKPPKEGEPNA